MTMRSILIPSCALLLAVVPYSTSLAQPEAPAASPIMQSIQAAKNHVNRFQYDSALMLGRELVTLSNLRRDQANAVYQLMAAIFHPEEGGTPMPDSARWYIGRAIRIMPDAPLDPAIKWPGLDSLFRAVRANTFASAVRASEDNALTGIDGRAFVDVTSTRPAAMTLQSISRSSGILTTHDSTATSTRARLGMRAHSGEQPNFISGEYEIRVVVRDLQTGAADTTRYSAVAIGAPPVLQSIPAVTPADLKPERSGLARAKGIAAGIIMGGATYAMARYARAEKPIRDERQADGRATSIGVLVGVGAIVGGFLDKGKPLPENIAANTITRAQFERNASTIRDSNRRVVSEYKVELRIDTRGER